MLKKGSIVVLADVVSVSYDGGYTDIDVYDNVIICEVTKDIEDIQAHMDDFKQSQTEILQCPDNCSFFLVDSDYKNCPYCGSKLIGRKQQTSLSSFIRHSDSLQFNDEVTLVEYNNYERR